MNCRCQSKSCHFELPDPSFNQDAKLTFRSKGARWVLGCWDEGHHCDHVTLKLQTGEWLWCQGLSWSVPNYRLRSSMWHRANGPFRGVNGSPVVFSGNGVLECKLSKDPWTLFLGQIWLLNKQLVVTCCHLWFLMVDCLAMILIGFNGKNTNHQILSGMSLTKKLTCEMPTGYSHFCTMSEYIMLIDTLFHVSM